MKIHEHSAELALERAALLFEGIPLLKGEDVAAMLKLLASGELPMPNGEPAITLHVEMTP